MATDPQRAHIEQRDADLGRLLVAWGHQNSVAVDGPLDAPGMDPRWIARVRTEEFVADLMLFYGTIVDVSAFRPSRPELGYLIGGEDIESDARFLEILRDLLVAAAGGADPNWLRRGPN